ncbi:MAG: hypothetical protein AB7O43_17330 [Hyphomicrobiaceae bacterium]
MAYAITDLIIGSQPIANTDTTKRHPLGTIVRAVDPTYGAGEFIYLLGVANTILGSAVTYNMDNGSTTLVVADAIGPVGIAMSANVANQYGWYQISGKAVVDCATVSDNGNVYASATAGELDDAVVAGDLVHNAKFASANGTPSAGLAELEISRPWMDDNVDDLDT